MHVLLIIIIIIMQGIYKAPALRLKAQNNTNRKIYMYIEIEISLLILILKNYKKDIHGMSSSLSLLGMTFVVD